MDVGYHVLGSGSKGNSSIVTHDGYSLMIDAGFSGKRLRERMEDTGISSDSLCGILVTHEHGDHVQGLRVFADGLNLPVYANALTAERLHHMKKYPERMVLFNNGAPFTVGPFTIEPFSISHDAVDPVGFLISVADRRLAVATDFGHAGKMLPFKISNCDVVMVESNYDPQMLRDSRRPPHLKHRILGRRGHLCNDGSAELVKEIAGPATKHVILGHLSEDCNCANLARETMQATLDSLNRTDIELQVATQHAITPAVSF